MKSTNIKAQRQKSAFAMQYSVSVDIMASPATVWGYLTDAANYPNWNSTVSKVEGDITLHESIKVFAKISPDRAFPVKVAVLEPHKKMVWQGGMPLGLFRGVRTFTLQGGANGGTTLHMKEDFSGLMLPLIAMSMPDLRPAFEDFAKDLKQAAE